MSRRIVWLLAVTTSAVACDARDVVVFRDDGGGSGGAGSGGVPEASSSGGATGTGGAVGTGGIASGGRASGTGGTDAGGLGCHTLADCAPSETCSKSDCNASVGVCEPRPTAFCDPTPNPVCGCDRITYWNDCVRRQNGVPASTSGECRSNALRCVFPQDCGISNASCANLLPPGTQCMNPQQQGPGNCWVVPDNCSSSNDPRRWQLCASPFPSPPASCVDTCSALLSPGIYSLMPRGACPPPGN